MNFKIGAKCAVYGCNNYKEKKGKKYFFAMTRDVGFLKEWILACHRKDLLDLLDVKEPDYFYYRHIICSDHFETKCFINKNKFKLGLRVGSIPTLNLYGVPNKLERSSVDEIDKTHEGNSLGIIDNKPDRKIPDKIVDKPERESLDTIDNKPEKKSLDKIVDKPERESLDTIDNKPEKKSLDKIVDKPERESLDTIDNKPEKKSLDKIVSNPSQSYVEEIKLEEVDLKPLEAILFKLSEDPCIFCGSMGNLRNLHSNNTEDNKTTENYLQMISSCFNIKLVDPSGSAGLCETCVSRLRDATSFRAQVEAAGTVIQQIKEKPTNLQTPEQQPTIEDKSSLCEIGEDIDTTFTYADCDTPMESGSREVLEITWSEDEEAGRKQGRVEWIDQVPKYQKVNSVEPKTQCEICGKQFNFMQAYHKHLGIHLKEHPLSCPLCDSSLASKKGLLAHIKYQHPDKKFEDIVSIYKIGEDVETTFTYANCDTPLESGSREVPELTWSEDEEAGRKLGRVEWIDQIPKYKKVESVEPKWIRGNGNKCPVCDKVILQRDKLKKHFEIHLPKTLCEFCGRQFNFLQTYKGHLGIHLKEHRVSCPQCNTSLASKTGLIAHIKTRHQGKKLYTCPKGCRDRFGSLYQRNEHLMKKHGVWYNRYECPECSLACFTPWKLDTHVRGVHRQEKNVECPECDRVFLDKSKMRKHLQTHSKEKNFMCDLCGKAFKSRVSIQKHLQIHYNIRENPCPFCDAAFVQTSSLQYHVRTHHKEVASISKKTRMKEDTKESEIVYTIIYHEDEGTKVEDVIM